MSDSPGFHRFLTRQSWFFARTRKSYYLDTYLLVTKGRTQLVSGCILVSDSEML